MHVLHVHILQGKSSQVSGASVSYAAYAHWQREMLSSGVFETQLEYWKTQLAGIEPLLLPSDRPRPTIQKYDGAMHAFRVPSEVLAGLKRISQVTYELHRWDVLQRLQRD